MPHSSGHGGYRTPLRAPPGIMGTCRGKKPPRDPDKRQLFELCRLKAQQGERTARPTTCPTQKRQEYNEHIATCMRKYHETHPGSTGPERMRAAAKSYQDKLSEAGGETKRDGEQRRKEANLAAKQEKAASAERAMRGRRPQMWQQQLEKMDKMRQSKKIAAGPGVLGGRNNIEQFGA